MKTYDRAQVLQVAAQLMPWILSEDEVRNASNRVEYSVDSAVEMAIALIDEVDRQCPLPGKPEATLPPLPRQGRRITP
jgi:hypothetical protein